MQIKFTETTLSSLSVPAGMRDHQWFDATLPGFGFRKFASGQAAYFVRYRIEQRQRKATLSKYVPGMLAQMRRKAAEILADAKRGIDAHQEPKKDLRFGEIIALYLEARQAELDAVWMKEVKRFLTQYWSRFHDRQFRSLERGELVRELDSIVRARGAATADHSRKALSAVFAWAIDRGYHDSNPLHRVKRRHKTSGRERALSMRELLAVWHAVGNEGDFSTIVRLLILTLQRRAEIADLRETELDLNRERQINLPATRTKNGREHIVPLSAPAQSLLIAHPRRVDRMLLFGDGQRGFQGWSKAKARLEIEVRRLLNPELMERFESRTGDLTDRTNRQHANKQAKALGFETDDDLLYSIMPRWTLHDLRRTGATLMNDFSLAEPHAIEAILNHVSSSGKAGVAGIYNRAKYEVQKRAALERWAEFLMSALASFEDGGLEGVDGLVVGSKDTEEIQQLLTTLRETLEKLECRAILFLASESYLRLEAEGVQTSAG